MKGGYETIPINQTGGGFSMNDTDCIRTKKQLKVGKKKKNHDSGRSIQKRLITSGNKYPLRSFSILPLRGTLVQ